MPARTCSDCDQLSLSSLRSRLSSFVKVLTLSPTASGGHRAVEHGRGRAPIETISTMGAVMVIELQEAIERALQRATTGEVLPAKGDAPVLVQDRFLQAFDEAVGPRVARLGARHLNPEARTPSGQGPLEFLAVVR